MQEYQDQIQFFQASLLLVVVVEQVIMEIADFLEDQVAEELLVQHIFL
jgi:hypothetical protein